MKKWKKWAIKGLVVFAVFTVRYFYRDPYWFLFFVPPIIWAVGSTFLVAEMTKKAEHALSVITCRWVDGNLHDYAGEIIRISSYAATTFCIVLTGLKLFMGNDLYDDVYLLSADDLQRLPFLSVLLNYVVELFILFVIAGFFLAFAYTIPSSILKIDSGKIDESRNCIYDFLQFIIFSHICGFIDLMDSVTAVLSPLFEIFR